MRDKTFGEDLQRVRTGSQPNAYAAIRNLITGAFRRAGYANIPHARRYYGRDERRFLALSRPTPVSGTAMSSTSTQTPALRPRTRSSRLAIVSLRP